MVSIYNIPLYARFADESSSLDSPPTTKSSRVPNLVLPENANTTVDNTGHLHDRQSSLSPKLATSRDDHRPLSPARIKRRQLLEESKKKKVRQEMWPFKRGGLLSG